MTSSVQDGRAGQRFAPEPAPERISGMDDSLSARFRISQELHEPNPLQAAFLARAIDGSYTWFRTEQWATSARSLEELPQPLMRSVAHGAETVLVEVGANLVILTLNGSFVFAQAAARERSAADAAIDRLRELLPAPEPTAAQDIPVMFWTYSPQGPVPSMRKISVPEWSEIRDNYPGRTRESLDALMQHFRPAHGGQLILWHGEVGTGKTFALRALAWEWRDWCQIHYIVDPDTFFGEHADYLMSVLMQSGGLGAHVGMMMATHPGMGYQHVFAYGVPDEEDELGVSVGEVREDDAEPARVPQWRLLVLEDTGELLRPMRRRSSGRGYRDS